MQEFMEQAGDITYVKRYKWTGTRQGTGVAEYRTEAGMRTALDKLHGLRLGSRHIELSKEARWTEPWGQTEAG